MSKTTIAIILTLAVAGLFTGTYTAMQNDHEEMDMTKRTENILGEKDSMIQTLIAEGDYACCLEKPCASCLTLSPWHGEGATCECLADIMTGKSPCGECTGGILSGRGNKFLAQHFATALAEEVGTKHLDTLKQIIQDKYGIPIENQL
jgi:hypothetical protein